MQPTEIKFNFIKAPECKEFGVDGAFGGISVSGRIVAAVYTERPPVPTCVVHSIDSDGKLGDEIVDRRESKDGMIRVIQAVLYFDLNSAVGFRDWLEKKINELTDIRDMTKS